jgi:putative transposon-encoded protein
VLRFRVELRSRDWRRLLQRIYFVYMSTTIRKWGNSLAVRLPKKEVAKRLRVREGSDVRIILLPNM